MISKLLILLLILSVPLVIAETIQTKLTIDNTIYPIEGQCIKEVCQETINNTKYVWWEE